MWSLSVFLVAAGVAAFTGARFSPGEWYETVQKAPWTPPNWLFPPVWTVLYVAMAVAGWRVWRARPEGRAAPLLLWSLQLVLNGAWSWLFFGQHRTGLALVDISLLLVVIIAFAVVSRPVSRAAAWLFAPYGAWVAYATSLNLYIWRFN